jgi:cytochrome c oxidase subunit 4
MDNARAPAAGHVVALWKYIAVYAALIVLTGATVGAALVDLGPLNNAVALGIAMVKAALVALYFMHVRYSPRLIPLALIIGVLWLVHLFGGTMSDYLTRDFLKVLGK